MRLLSWTLWGLLGVSQAVRLGAWSLPPAEGSGGAWLGGWSSYTLQAILLYRRVQWVQPCAAAPRVSCGTHTAPLTLGAPKVLW